MNSSYFRIIGYINDARRKNSRELRVIIRLDFLCQIKYLCM
jgi:hypothetical protein